MDDGGISAAAIEVLVQNLINVFKEEYFLLRGLDREAQQLQKTMIMVQAYLSDAENKSITQHAVKIWLRELEGIAFNADIVLDELSYHLLRKDVNKLKTPKGKDKVLSFFSSLNHISHRRNMAHAIKKINATFKSMNNRARDLGLQSILVNAPVAAPTASLETDSITVDPVFVGRDDDVPKLVQVLIQAHPPEQTFSILALVGMGGMGKTTLTRKVFNHERVKARFGLFIWVHVSQTFDPIILFNKLLSTLTSHAGFGIESREVILKRLQEALKSKTYLLVLDDVWNEDVSKWEDFINSISGVTSTEGNGIIITTRSQKVASIVNPLEIHSLNGLSHEDCWSIIKAKAFYGNREVPPGLERIGKKIAERCQGLPLAANVVGGVLRSKSEEEWRFINENWLSNDDEAQNITKILKLSFDHLSPPSLKKCFAYCSIFSKGAEMEKQKVIELWMAEGFLQLDGRCEMESVGNKFFDVLLRNSLLIVAQRDIYGDVKSCVMHDLVHDLASSVLNGSHNVDGITPVRYMIHEEASPIPEEVAKHLRTLFFKGVTSVTMFSNFECLHNLSLTSSDCTELPNSIRELIHLRNLNISNTRTVNLPEWIGELYHLQTLRALCLATQKLPSTLKYLIKLRHLHIDSRVELPADMGRLTCLQTVVHFRVGKEKGYQIEELGSLRNLKGRLEIRNLDRVRDKEEALKANMFEKSNLSYLVFHWNEQREDESRSDESVLEGLQPHENANLKVLKIEGFKGKRFPTWTRKMAVWDGLQGSYAPLDKLFSITFRRCSECEEIPMLEHLPNLKSLSFQGLKKVRFINCSSNHLTDLTISGLERMEGLPDGLFYNNRNLSNLMIYECPLLRELPDGLDTLNSLEQLYIRDCPNLRSIGNPSVQSQGILTTLRLWISGCGELKEFPREMLESWAPSVEYLELRGLRSLNNLPELITCLSKSSPRLAEMTILGVPDFTASSPSVEGSGLGRLKELKIDVSVEWSEEKSDSIKHTVEVLLEGCCNSLTHLNLKGVQNWEWIPQSVQHLTALDWLRLENIGVEELPQWFWNLSSLTRLSLYSCNKLRHLPAVDALNPLTKLVWLEIKDCPELCIDPEWRSNVTVYVDGRSLAAA